MIDPGDWGLKNRRLVYFLVAVLVAGGIFAYDKMSKLEDPEIKVKQAVVVTTYPGASAHQVELEVTDILENAIRSMKNIDHTESRSMNDLSMITVHLSSTVPNDELEQNWTILRRKVGDVQSSLPDGASASIVKDDFGDVYGMFYALTTDGFSDRELGRYAELIKREIRSIDGISRVELYGERKECINIDLLEDRMSNLGILPAEVLSTLNGQNQTIYSGYYESEDYRLRVMVNDKYRTVEDIGSILLQGHQNDQFRLSDIADISISYEDPTRNEMFYDGVRSIGISIAAQSGTDITKLGKEVETRIGELEKSQLPAGIELHKVFFQPDRVNKSLNGFLLNLVESVLIVVFILMLTMGFRSGMIIGVNLIIIVLGSLLILGMTGGTLQRVSLAAFILAMGMLVDNAIVIIDGILVDMSKGKSRREALTAIGRQTAMPLLGATLIAILAFLPIYLSPDTTGVYVRDLFIVLAVSLLLSWILALVLVPMMAKSYLRVKPPEEGKDPYDNKYYHALRSVLMWVLRHRTVTICLAVGLMVLTGIGFQQLPKGFFPDMDYDQLYVEYKLPEGINSTRTRKDLLSISDYLRSREDVTHVTVSVGGTPSRYNLVRGMGDNSLSYGELIIDYTSSSALVSSMEEIQRYLTDAYPDAYVRLKRYNLMSRKYPIEVQFNGPDPAVLRDLTIQAQEIMRESDAIYMINSDWEDKTPTLMVDYKQPVARDVGLSRQDVGLSLLSATGGIPASSFYDDTRKQTVYLRCVGSDGKPIESLENAPVFSMLPSMNGLDNNTILSLMSGALSEEDVLQALTRSIPVSQVSDGIKLVWEDPLVVRYNGQRAMRAQCVPIPGFATEDARQTIAEQIENIELPTGYSLQWEGEKKASGNSTRYLFRTYPLAIILIITILILLFKDYKKPLIILCSIPLLLIGVVVGMLISGKTFGFVAIVGVLGLVGMMIKNGIVLMDEIKLQIGQGVEPVNALLNSSASRFRPVMMASMTTILGMIPLLSDDLFGPLAVTIMGGLFIGTLITLLFIPFLYSIFFRIKINKPQ